MYCVGQRAGPPLIRESEAVAGRLGGAKHERCLDNTASILLFSLRITSARYRKDLRKPFDVSLKGSFRLINVVIPSVERTKKTLEAFIR